MTMATNILSTVSRVRRTRTTQEPTWVRRALIALALAFLTLFLFVPLILVFYEALKKGVDVYFAAIVEPDASGSTMAAK